MYFFLFYFNAVLLSLLWFFYPRRPSKRHKRRPKSNIWRYSLSDAFWTTVWASSTK